MRRGTSNSLPSLKHLELEGSRCTPLPPDVLFLTPNALWCLAIFWSVRVLSRTHHMSNQLRGSMLDAWICSLPRMRNLTVAECCHHCMHTALWLHPSLLRALRSLPHVQDRTLPHFWHLAPDPTL